MVIEAGYFAVKSQFAKKWPLRASILSQTTCLLERDLDSLFTDGATTALTQTIGGLDDFELIAFIAIVDPAQDTV